MGQAADFFVSYTSADRIWAEWIAWQLEDQGYQVVVQAWDFTPATIGPTRCSRPPSPLSEWWRCSHPPKCRADPYSIGMLSSPWAA
jgi:hypothetical protein